jgi:Protein of unknown function (DUF732)
MSRIPTVAAVALAAAMSLSPATANASPEDQRVLDAVANLEIQFGTPQQAIDAGRGVCGTISSGQASGVSPEGIRSKIVSGLQSKGLDGAQAANFMWAATDIYCPHYNDVVGD